MRDPQSIEPKFYMPVLPLVLVNGAEGIGTGWSSSVPNYNPREIVANLKRMMDGGTAEPMTPWYRGFTGTIVPADARGTSFTTHGTVGKLDESTLLISELPIRKWTQDYKDAVLEPMLSGTPAAENGKGAAVAPTLDDVREHHTDTTVSFTVRFAGGATALGELEGKGQLHKTLKLSSSIATSNMTLFDEHGRIQKHEAPEGILESFYTLRLAYYEKRKLMLSDKLTEAWSRLDNRMRFVLAVVSGELKIANVKKDVLVATLAKQGYAAFEPPSKAKKRSDDADDDDDDNDDDKAAAKGGAASARGYDYLLGMPLWSLTLEKVEQLRAELVAKEAELQALLATTPKSLWTADLDAFLAGYEAWEAELQAAEAGVPAKKGGAKGKAKAAPKKKPKKFVGSDDEEDDDDESDFMDDDDSDYDEKKKKKKPPPKAKAAAKAPPSLPPPTAAAVPIAAPVVPLAQAPKRKAAPVQAAPKAAPAPAVAVPKDEDSEDDGPGLSLMARMRAKMGAPAADGGGPSPAAQPAVKRVCDKASPIGAALKAAAAGRRKLGKKPITPLVAVDAADDAADAMSDDDDDEEEEVEKAPLKKAAPKPRAPPKAKAKKAASESDEDDDEYAEAVPAARAAPAAR